MMTPKPDSVKRPMKSEKTGQPIAASVDKEDFTAKKARVETIIGRLAKAYPDAKCSLNHNSPLELLVATILSAQCTDERVNIVTETLFRKYRTPADYADADISEIEEDIRSTGFFRNKARSVQGAARKLIEDFGGEVPRTMDELLTLPGVARKTANVVLGNAFGKAPGVVVDTHVSRLSNRLKFTENTAPEKIEKDLIQLVPSADWVMFPHWMIYHGRAVCKARAPQCADCSLADLCPSSKSEN